MILKSGKFYDEAGNVVPLEFGNKEQIKLMDMASALSGGGVCLQLIGSKETTEFVFQCLCGVLHRPDVNASFKCTCGQWYKCFDTDYMPAVKFAKK